MFIPENFRLILHKLPGRGDCGKSFCGAIKMEMRQATSLLNSTGSVIFIMSLMRALPAGLYSKILLE